MSFLLWFYLFLFEKWVAGTTVYSGSKKRTENGKKSFSSLATKILSSVVSEEKEFLACLILKIVVSDKSR